MDRSNVLVVEERSKETAPEEAIDEQKREINPKNPCFSNQGNKTRFGKKRKRQSKSCGCRFELEF